MDRRAILIGIGSLTCIACREASPKLVWPFTGVDPQHLASPAPWYETVSLVELICQREKFDGKPIRVAGFGHLEFEGTALYLHQDDAEFHITMNSVGLAVSDSDPEFTMWNDRYVLVEGTFRAWPRGPQTANLRAGIIEHISRYDPRPTRDEMRREVPHSHQGTARHD
jgi:hypothetical protein